MVDRSALMKYYLRKLSLGEGSVTDAQLQTKLLIRAPSVFPNASVEEDRETNYDIKYAV